jgi:hypothetical protein
MKLHIHTTSLAIYIGLASTLSLQASDRSTDIKAPSSPARTLSITVDSPRAFGAASAAGSLSAPISPINMELALPLPSLTPSHASSSTSKPKKKAQWLVQLQQAQQESIRAAQAHREEQAAFNKALMTTIAAMGERLDALTKQQQAIIEQRATVENAVFGEQSEHVPTLRVGGLVEQIKAAQHSILTLHKYMTQTIAPKLTCLASRTPGCNDITFPVPPKPVGTTVAAADLPSAIVFKKPLPPIPPLAMSSSSSSSSSSTPAPAPRVPTEEKEEVKR